MTFRTLIRRNLRFHWRSHLGVVLGAAIGSAALIGALVVGDSVRESLKEKALSRLGWIDLMLHSRDRFFSATLEDHYRSRNDEFAKLRSAALLHLPATINRTDDAARVNAINVFGVDENFRTNSAAIPKDSVVLNRSLAAQLKATVGDEVIIRVPKPSSLSLETPLAAKNDNSVALRLKVSSIAEASDLGDFAINASPLPPANAFVSLSTLGESVGTTNKANVLLLGDIRATSWFNDLTFAAVRPKWQTWLWIQWRVLKAKITGTSPLDPSDVPTEKAVAFANAELGEISSLSTWGMHLASSPTPPGTELRSDQIFLEPALVRAVKETNVGEFVFADNVARQFSLATNHHDILTYLVTLLQAGTNATPYSMVSAAGAPWTPADLRDDEIMVSQWLADDLHVKAGDAMALVYFDPESGARLTERTNVLRVRGIVPAEMPWSDRTLMPDFPGIEKAESTSEWDAGFPLVYKIRDKDEEYWKNHRGTPKAFVTLAAGQKMWGNRFGNLTAIRFPISTNEDFGRLLEPKILANLKPEELGLRFEPVREQALEAANKSQPFGQLFLGFSFFLILAALLLMAMLFQFGLEQRAPEIGTLLSLGFTPGQVRKLLLREGVVLAFIGGVVGAVGGIYFAKAMLHGLTTIWREAVGGTLLNFHFTGQTLAIGIFSSVIVSAITIWLALRKFVKRPARELLVGEIGSEPTRLRSVKSKVFAASAIVIALALAVATFARGDTANAGAFFGAGALILLGGLGFVNAWLIGLGSGQTATLPTLSTLAVKGGARRRKRSLATVAMLACGSFLIVSIGVFRLDANRDAHEKTSGTGGFALIGETTMPVVHDLNAPSGRDFFALNERDLEGVNFVPFRVLAGDEASCLNLNAAQKPRLLGVKPVMLATRFTFAKYPSEMTKMGAWRALEKSNLSVPLDKDEIPAIGDANSIQWAMHKKVGDTIDYVDERGQPFKVRIIGAVANSILQGQLIIDEAEFVKRFPGESGYRMFLIDAPSNSVSQVSATLSRAMQDVGLELTPAAQRLAQFNAVQNTYLGTFQVLGGLGLLLGSVGLGIVVLRNVLERRGELAVLLAVGFRKASVQTLLLLENGVLLLLGLGIGVVAAAIAVLPAVLSPGGQLPYASLALTLAAVLVNGALWTWAATRFAVRGDLLKALRNE